MRTPWKVYRDGEHIASTAYPEDAARLAWSSSRVVKWDHRVVVWSEGSEGFAARKSYDRAAEVMRDRRDEYLAAAKRRAKRRGIAIKREIAERSSRGFYV